MGLSVLFKHTFLSKQLWNMFLTKMNIYFIISVSRKETSPSAFICTVINFEPALIWLLQWSQSLCWTFSPPWVTEVSRAIWELKIMNDFNTAYACANADYTSTHPHFFTLTTFFDTPSLMVPFSLSHTHFSLPTFP